MFDIKYVPPWVLQQSLEVLAGAQTLHHALLITGRRGSGQRELALLIAAARLCESGDAQRTRGCGRCPACHWLQEGHHLDFRWVRPEAEQPAASEVQGRSARAAKPSREIVIDQIRDLAAFVELSSHRGAERVVLIDPADAMNAAAANALLKTLEEPPPGVQFLLTSERPDRLPATVRSRCRIVPLRQPPASEIRAWIAQQADVPEPQAALALAASSGAAVAALGLLRGSERTAHDQILQVLRALPDADVLESADPLAQTEPEHLVRALYAWVLDLGRVRAGAAPLQFAGDRERLSALASRIEITALAQMEQFLLEQLRWAQHPLNPRLFIENTLFRYCELFGRGRGHRGDSVSARRKIA